MSKINFKKELKEFYKASAKNVARVSVPKMNYLMVDGEPGSEAYAAAVAALYSVSDTLKFMIKKRAGCRLWCYAARRTLVGGQYV